MVNKRQFFNRNFAKILSRCRDEISRDLNKLCVDDVMSELFPFSISFKKTRKFHEPSESTQMASIPAHNLVAKIRSKNSAQI